MSKRIHPIEEETRLHAAWMRELYREHQDICWRHRVDLKVPAIEITGSARQWGAWNPASRTIQVSAHLITGHSWDVTLSVFKHEMAHQIVTDIFEATEVHGPLFERACAMIGVPEPFRRAGGDLPRRIGTPHDEGIDSAGMRRLDKVRKLLSLARSGNEHEALLAMEKAHELMEKYHIQRIEQDEVAGFVYAIIHHKKKRIENVQRRIGRILQDHFFVNVVFSYLYDPADGATYRTMELLGTAENVPMAEYVYWFLVNQMEVLWKAHRRKAASPAPRDKRSYRLGVLTGFHDKLDRQAADRRRRRRADDTGGPGAVRALILAEDRRLKAFTRMRFPRLSLRRSGGARIDPGAYQAGVDDGGQLNLHQGIRQRDGFLGGLLTDSVDS